MMSNRHSDINDDEIRVISSADVKPGKPRRRLLAVLLWAVAALLVVAALGMIFFSMADADEDDPTPVAASVTEPSEAPAPPAVTDTPAAARPFTVRTDTIAGGIGLIILTPANATPVLEVGSDVTADSAAVLIVQAADIRGDNGGIVGSFVAKGELIGKGEAKAGFCSIINGEVTIGVADATPMFEQALMTDGYFFRQYPLVVGGQIVENRPKGKAVRRALAEIGGRICVVVSRDKTSFHDFSQALTDAGVSNAIYLVGGNAYGRYVDSEGRAFTLGHKWDNDIDNVNFMVWR